MLTHFMLGHRPLLDNIISTFTQGRPRLPQSLLLLPSNCCHPKRLIDSLFDLLNEIIYIFIYISLTEEFYSFERHGIMVLEFS